MDDERFSIEELADAAGLTRRGVRFYVQQRLIPAPHGVGRGKHYDPSHLARLRQVRELQSAGHSLEEIRQILSGGRNGKAASVAAPARRNVTTAKPTPAPLRAELWRRVRVMEGVELSFDSARFNPSVEDLSRLRDEIARTLKGE